VVDTLSHLFAGFALTGDLATDAPAFLRFHGRDGIARHVSLVAANARQLAARTGAGEQAALSAAWLHDISRVLPEADMVEPARQCGVALLPEEVALPQLVHGKLSAVLAERYFGVEDPVVLDAIRCHTTLRPNPTLLDKVLFIADKLAWAPHEAPYHGALTAALERSLDEAVACFLDWSMAQGYRVVHPWLRQAHAQFCRT
jgi:predicted HD superfamily hydrolase involved in NAD metabolism